MSKMNTKKKSLYIEKMERFGIKITIEDIYSPHVKYKRDKKQIIITNIGGKSQGNWTTFDLKRISEVWKEFLKMKEYTFKIKETEKVGLKRLKEERLSTDEEILSIWQDKRRGKEWLAFQKENR